MSNPSTVHSPVPTILIKLASHLGISGDFGSPGDLVDVISSELPSPTLTELGRAYRRLETVEGPERIRVADSINEILDPVDFLYGLANDIEVEDSPKSRRISTSGGSPRSPAYRSLVPFLKKQVIELVSRPQSISSACTNATVRMREAKLKRGITDLLGVGRSVRPPGHLVITLMVFLTALFVLSVVSVFPDSSLYSTSFSVIYAVSWYPVLRGPIRHKFRESRREMRRK